MLFVSHDLKEAESGPKASEYTLAPGATKLPCILETTIISDVEGYFTCRVTTNVYDTATGRHLLVPQGSTVLGNDQANTLVYGSNRMDTVSLTLALPDGRTVDLGRAPVTDQQGVAGLTGDVNNHYCQALWRGAHRRGAEGRHECVPDRRDRSRRGGTSDVRAHDAGQPGDDESGAALHQHSPDDHDRGGPTLHGPAHQAAAPAGDVAGHGHPHHPEVGMTKAERLAAKIARDKETLEKQRLALAQNEAALREETRRRRTSGATRSGRWPMRRGCWRGAMPRSRPSLRGSLALRAQSADLLATLLAEPVPSSERRENGVAESATRVSAAH